MDVFQLRDEVIDEYARYVKSFLVIRDSEIERRVDEKLRAGLLWPDPLVQLNPAFEPGPPVAELVDGPPHDLADQQAKDREQQDALEDYGYTVLRFHHLDDWEDLLRRHEGIFGKGVSAAP